MCEWVYVHLPKYSAPKGIAIRDVAGTVALTVRESALRPGMLLSRTPFRWLRGWHPKACAWNGRDRLRPRYSLSIPRTS